MQVHIDRNGERFGPYSLEEVNAYLANGTLLPTDLAWHDGMADWVPISQITGVTIAGGSPPPAAGATCPQCQAPVEASQVICMGCGTNLQSGQTPALQTTSNSTGNKKLLIGVGTVVGVLALAAAGYFVIYPKISGDKNKQESSDIVENERGSVVGEYQYKHKPEPHHLFQESFTNKLVLLDNGISEFHINGKKKTESKWKIVDGEIYVGPAKGIIVYRINTDKSITLIVSISDGKRTDRPKEKQFTYKKIK